MTLATRDGFTFRAFTPADVPLLARWRADERVAEWYWGPRDVAGLRAHYVDAPGREHITQAIAERDGAPVGYVQWYPCEPEYLAAAHLTGEPGVWAIDLHLAPDLVGSGLGAPLARAVAAHLRATVARRVVIDPEVRNVRAVKAYEKAGFVAVRVMPGYTERDGGTRDNLLMEWQPLS